MEERHAAALAEATEPGSDWTCDAVKMATAAQGRHRVRDTAECGASTDPQHQRARLFDTYIDTNSAYVRSVRSEFDCLTQVVGSR